MRILKDNKIDCIWSRESLLSKKTPETLGQNLIYLPENSKIPKLS